MLNIDYNFWNGGNPCAKCYSNINYVIFVRSKALFTLLYAENQPFFSNCWQLLKILIFLKIWLYFLGSLHHSSRHLVSGIGEDLKSETLSDLDPQLASSQPAEDDEVPSPNHVPHGPSPEPKIEDTECHRSQSAMWEFIYTYTDTYMDNMTVK